MQTSHSYSRTNTFSTSHSTGFLRLRANRPTSTPCFTLLKEQAYLRRSTPLTVGFTNIVQQQYSVKDQYSITTVFCSFATPTLFDDSTRPRLRYPLRPSSFSPPMNRKSINFIFRPISYLKSAHRTWEKEVWSHRCIQPRVSHDNNREKAAILNIT